MPQIPALFDGHVRFDPEMDFEGFARQVPARWAVYLMCDEQDRPIQLLCVKNLRASLKRRLGADEQIGPSRRVNYRELVRNIHYRRVDSHFEADWLYFEIARHLFPESYQGMVGFRPAWFVHVNPQTQFPRYTKTTDLSRQGLYIGPVEDKHVAARMIELVEDAFDLCRYYNLLIEAPNAKACAYKEMGKCPAPCDGSVSMEQYRLVIDWSARTLVDPADSVRMHSGRMQHAAAELKFESAAKIKSYVDQLSQFGKGPYRHARWLKDFQFVSFQHGPREGTVKVFLITPGQIREIAGMIDSPRWPAELLGLVLHSAEILPSPRPGRGQSPNPLPSPGVSGEGENARAREENCGVSEAERIGIVTGHLFSAKPGHGIFVRLDELDEKGIARAYRELLKRPAEEAGESEGVLKELQSL